MWVETEANETETEMQMDTETERGMKDRNGDRMMMPTEKN